MFALHESWRVLHHKTFRLASANVVADGVTKVASRLQLKRISFSRGG